MAEVATSESDQVYVEPVVKITVSPNTPSPEPSDDDQGVNESTREEEDTNSSKTSPTEHYCVDEMEQNKPDSCFPDVPTCIDFGIQDYLCRVQHETEFDLSSDTDTSYLGATPPHRFSDGEIDPIEAMPVLLDTKLNVTVGSLSSLMTEKDEFSAPFSLGCSWKDPAVQRFLAKSVSKESVLSLHFNTGQSNNYKFKALQIQERRLPRPFKRNISLPATIFKTVLADHSKLDSNSKNNNSLETTVSSGDIREPAMEIQGVPRLSKIDSISNSSQTDVLSLEQSSQTCNSLTPETEMIPQDGIGSGWNISADSEPEDGENQPFTSELEKRSLMIRHMRRLIRQDTSGNFAPPDYHI